MWSVVGTLQSPSHYTNVVGLPWTSCIGTSEPCIPYLESRTYNSCRAWMCVCVNKYDIVMGFGDIFYEEMFNPLV